MKTETTKQTINETGCITSTTDYNVNDIKTVLVTEFKFESTGHKDFSVSIEFNNGNTVTLSAPCFSVHTRIGREIPLYEDMPDKEKAKINTTDRKHLIV